MKALSAKWVSLGLQVVPLTLAAGGITAASARWLGPIFTNDLRLPVLLLAVLLYPLFLLSFSRPLWSALAFFAFAAAVGAASGGWLLAAEGEASRQAAGWAVAALLAGAMVGRRLRRIAGLPQRALRGALCVYLLVWPLLLGLKSGGGLLRLWAAMGVIVFVLLAALWARKLDPDAAQPIFRLVGDSYIIILNLTVALALLLTPR